MTRIVFVRREAHQDDIKTTHELFTNHLHSVMRMNKLVYSTCLHDCMSVFDSRYVESLP